MEHAKPNLGKVNTSIGHVPQKSHGLGGGRAKGVSVSKEKTASEHVGGCGKVAWGPINPKPGKG